MEGKLESGSVESMQKTTKTAEIDGVKHIAEVIRNKETGEVKQTIDGKPVEEKKQAKPIRFKPTANDFQIILIALLQDIKAVMFILLFLI